MATMITADQGFDETYYLQQKAAQMTAASGTVWTPAQVSAAFAQVGLTAAQHYSLYGYAEGLSPNAYFNADEYAQSKATAAGMTVDQFKAAWKAASGSDNLYLHYVEYGAFEDNVNPSSSFSDYNYYVAKAAEMGSGYTWENARDAIKAAGLTAITHYMQFGITEGLSYSPSATADSYALTSDTDIATANVFNAGLVYNPGGTDRVNSLQNEDVLTGLTSRTDNTLNATLGNAGDNGGRTVNPILHNIQVINTQFTGDDQYQGYGVDRFDLRGSDADFTTLNITRIGALGDVQYQNIPNVVANLGVSNNAIDTTTAAFNFQDGVLAGTDDTSTLTLANVDMKSVTIGGNSNSEGFETLTVLSNGTGSNTLKSLSDAQLQNLTIEGAQNLTLLDSASLIDTTSGKVEGTKITAGEGVAAPNSVGLRTIDAATFTGDLSIDITNAVGGHNDPDASGTKFFTTITGGSGDDTFYTGAVMTGAEGDLHDVLNGGEGTNTVVTYSNIVGGTKGATISNIQDLEVRNAATSASTGGIPSVGTQTVDFTAFTDSGPSSVLLRNEAQAAGVATFDLQNIGSTLAASGDVVLHHGVTTSEGKVDGEDQYSDVVKMQLTDATGSDDTIALKVVNDQNTTTTFNYTLDTTAMPVSDTDSTPNGKVENVSINDADSESNVVTLANAADHTGTITLTGGTAGTTYKVNYADGTTPLLATTVDASTQASNLFLQVAPGSTTTQTVKLGTGNDDLLFANTARDDGSLDLLKGTETVTDAGGTDVVTAIFSKDVTGTPTLTGIETFQTAATANVAMDLSKTSLTTLNLLSEEAVNGTSGSSDLYDLTSGTVTTSSVITANGTTAVASLNFAGTNDDGTAGDTGSKDQVFNGVTLEDSATTLAVNINSQALGLDNKTHVEAGAKTYSLGQLTAQSATTMNITVSDEAAIASGETSSTTTTAIDNIWAKNLQTLTVTANGSVDLGTVTGNATNNNQTSVDATAVKGAFVANDIALGDNAVVKIGDGGSNFSALGSAGKAVTITAGNGVNTITGTAQNDTITTGSAADTVHGDRGDNVISVGAGNDTVTAKNGSNTINLGSGTLESVALNKSTGLSSAQATNVVTGNGTVAAIEIDTDGDGTAEFAQDIAVGQGHDLGVSWLGNTIQTASSTLDGRVAETISGAYTASTAQAHLVIGSADSGTTTTQVDLSKSTASVFLDYAADGTSDAGTGGITVTGSTGNDAIVLTNNAADTITGGAGADYIVLSTEAKVDTINIADGNSTLSGYDQYYNYNTQTDSDVFTLSTTNIAATVSSWTDSGLTLDNGDTVYYEVSAAGLVTFADNSTGPANVFVGTTTDDTHITLDEATSALNSKVSSMSAAAFNYDANNDGIVDASFIYQNTSSGTLAELVNDTLSAGLTVVGTGFTVA